MEVIPIPGLLYLLRFISLIIGVVDIVLTTHSFSTLFSEDTTFLVVISIGLAGSLILMLGFITRSLDEGNEMVKYIDIWFHLALALFLLVGGVVMLMVTMDRVPTPDLHSQTGTRLVVERTLLAAFGVQNGLIYGTIGTLLLKTVQGTGTRRNSEDDEWEDALIRSHESSKSNFGAITPEFLLPKTFRK